MVEEHLRILGIAGSLRRHSYNRALLRAAAELTPAGVTLDIFELDQVPLFNEDVEAEGDPAPVQALKKAIADAHALLIATPEYNHGPAAVTKNAVDWASRPPKESALDGKPVAVMGATPGGTGTARAQTQLRQSFVFTNSYPLQKPELLVSHAAQVFDAQGRLTDEKTRKKLTSFIEALAAWTRRLAA